MSRFNGMVAIVIGGASNIGRATVRLLARDGAKVAVGYNSDQAGADETVRLVEAEGGTVFAMKLDHTDEAQVRALVERTVATWGALHILVNNAAGTSGAFLARDRDIVNMDADYWDAAMRVNLKGPMLACKHAIPHMIAAGHGAIVNTGSGVTFRGDTVRNAYAASKIGLHSLTMDIATSYGAQNIRCNLVSPGLVLTEMVRASLPPEAYAAVLADNLVPYVGEPEDIAEVTCFLASPAARYVTGQVIAVDGGRHVHECCTGQA